MALTRPKIWDIDTNIQYFMDPMTVLHQGSTAANVDVGFLFNRANGLVSNVALYWQESSQSFVAGYTTGDGTTNSNVSISSYANLTVGNVLMVNGSILNVTGNIYGNITGDLYGNVITTANAVLGNVTTATVNATTVITTSFSASSVTASSVATPSVTATSVSAATVGNIGANHVGTGTYLTSLNASNLSSGTVPLAQLSGITTTQLSATAGVTNGQLANSAVTVTAGAGLSGGGTVALGSAITLNLQSTQALTTLNAATIGNIGANHVGTGTYLTSLNASNLSSGTVPSAQVAGAYSGITGVGTLATLAVAGDAAVGGNLSVGNLNITSGNVTINNSGSFIGNSVTGYGALYAGIPSGFAVLPSTPLEIATNGNTYSQLNMQNINNGSLASTDYVVTAGNGNDSTFYGDFGIASNTYSYPALGLTSVGPNDVYLLGVGYNSLGPYTGNVGNVVISSSNGMIKLATGGANIANVVATVIGTGFAVNATTTSTSTSTGALTVAGGAGITGNLYAGTVYTSGLRWSANGAPMQTGGGGGTGITYTASTTAPSFPNVGDQWYYTTGDILYEYQNVGTGSFWIDITSPTVASGNVTIPGGDTFSPFLLMGA